MEASISPILLNLVIHLTVMKRESLVERTSNMVEYRLHDFKENLQY